MAVTLRSHLKGIIMPLYNPHIWYPIIGRKVLVKVEYNVMDEDRFSSLFRSPLQPVTYHKEIRMEERYYLGNYKDYFLVSEELPKEGSVAYYVEEVFEAPKKEYTMQEIADALEINIRDLRIKK